MRNRYLIAIFGLMSGALLAAERPYSRYEPIVTRAPFGQPPANFNPAVNPSTVSARSGANGGKELTAEQEQLKKTVKFSAINLDPEDGELRVGFSDLSSAKMPRHYYLKVGESRDGWVVNEANAAERRVKISKDGVELELDLGNEATGATAKNAATPAPLAAAAAPTAKAVSDDKPSNRLLGRRGMLAQRKEREEKRKAEQEAEKKRQEEERAKMREELATLSEEVRQAREERERAKEAEAAAPKPVAEDPPPQPRPEEEGGEGENGEE